MSQLPQLPTLPGIGFGHQYAQFPPFSPAEQQSAIDALLAKGMGGLEYVGDTLGKPGRAVRGLLAGRPHELLNLLPFSDTVGLTDPKDQVTGRDLLDQVGLLPKGETGFLPWAAGFATDVLTDPLAYVSPAGLTAAGREAEAAGTLTKGLGKAMGTGERAALRVHLPLMPSQGLADLGAGSEAIGGAVTDLGQQLRTSGPGRAFKMLFDPSAGGELTAEAQAAQALKHAKLPQAMREARQTILDVGDPYAEALNEFKASNAPLRDQLLEAGAEPADADRILQQAAERGIRFTAEMRDRPQLLGEFAADNPLMQAIYQNPQNPATVAAAEKITGTAKGLNAALEERGAPVDWIVSNYAPRTGIKPVTEAERLARQRVMPTTAGFMQGRELATKDLPEELMQALRSDPLAHVAASQTMEPAVQHILDSYGAWLKPGEELEHATALAGWVADHPGTKAIYQPIGQSTETYIKGAKRALAGWDSAHEFFNDNLVMAGTAGSVPLEQAFKSLAPGMSDLQTERAMRWFAEKMLKGAPVGEAYKLAVPENVATAARGLIKPVVDPEWRGLIGRTIDWMNTSFTQHVTMPFAAFFTRNARFANAASLLSGRIENPADALAFGKSAVNAGLEAIKGPTAERLRLAELYGLVPKNFAEVEGQGLARELKNGFENPLRVPTTWGQAKQFVAEHPMAEDTLFSGIGQKLGQLPGMATARAADRTLLSSGAKANEFIKWQANMGLFDYLTGAKGWAPEAAAEEVKRIQFHYAGGGLTPFEKTYMKRLVPFYSFQKNVLKYVVGSLAQEPGGAIAQGIRATQDARGGGYTPEYLAEGMAIPLNDQGRYLSGFDAPWERAFSTAVIAPTVAKTVGRTTERAIAQMSPALSTAYAMASGRDPFTGRDTKDLYAYPTANALLNAAVHGSPLTRAVSTVRTLGDERKEPWVKAVNLLGLGHITDVSGGVQHAKEIEARQLLNQVMSEAPNIRSRTEFYADPAHRANLTPDETNLLRIAAGLDQSGKDFAKTRKAAELFGSTK